MISTIAILSGRSTPRILLQLPICSIQRHYTTQSTRQNNTDPGLLQNRTRNIQYAFDPANIPTETRPSNPFPFLGPQRIAFPIFQHANAIAPSTVGVPWPTLLPSSLQSKYWIEVEEAAKAFTQEILARRSKDKKTKYFDAMIDAAVSLLVNAVPMGNLTRMKILTKLYVFFFMSDDVVDSGNRVTMIPSHDALQQEPGSDITVYDMLAREILSEDTIQGARLLESVISWVSAAQKKPHESFPTLEDYMTYRVGDVGVGAVFRSVEFACDIPLSETDLEAVARLRSLCEKHFLLTNDLYSYAKEAIAEQAHGDPVLNAVRVVQRFMNTSVALATAIVRQVIRDVENQMNDEYEHLAQGATNPQLTYAQGLITAVAGNMFFSATCPRYARAVQGSRLHA